MPATDRLRALITGADAMLWGRRASVWLGNLAWGSTLGRALEQLAGANVLLRTGDPLFAALALIELDGVAARIVFAPAGLKDEELPAIIERTAVTAVVGEDLALAVPGLRFVRAALPLTPLAETPPPRETEWVLFTAGATGHPKLVSHSLKSLTGAIRADAVKNGAVRDVVWGTFYDIRRFAGVQILLRALLSRASLVLPDDGEEAGDFLVRLGRHGVTHLTGMPSHWRRALMSPANLKIAPRNVRLSGEVAEQALLDSLKTRFPGAAIVHAYGSTEAGVGFEVNDGREGFPAAIVGQPGAVEIRVVNSSLHIRSPRIALGYVGGQDLMTDGFVDTGDLVELWGDRYFFVGRRGGVLPASERRRTPEQVG